MHMTLNIDQFVHRLKYKVDTESSYIADSYRANSIRSMYIFSVYVGHLELRLTFVSKIVNPLAGECVDATIQVLNGVKINNWRRFILRNFTEANQFADSFINLLNLIKEETKALDVLA